MNHPAFGSEAQRVFSALADSTRCALLERLRDGESSASRLAKPLGISRQAVAKHLHVLAEAGLVRYWREGRETVFEIRLQGLAPAEAYLKSLRAAGDKVPATG